jgi:hypothetical protein
MFVDNTQYDAVTEGKNSIYIRKKLDFGQRTTVETAAAMAATNASSDLIGAMMLAFIVRWEGPDFEGVSCTAANIRRLDPDEPLVERVHDEIVRRYTATTKESPDPN